MKKSLTLLFALLVTASAALPAQVILTAEAQDITRGSLLSAILGRRFDYDAQNYAVTYTTVDAFGQPDTASGLLSIPLTNNDLAFPIAVYNHGTVTDRDAVPSRQGVVERTFAGALAASGYVAVAPDYIGLGDSDGFHPYVHAASEASAGRDLVIAARDFVAARGLVSTNGQLFLTGYSQGGHASMAQHMDLQLNPGDDDLEVTAAAHLSGPYAIYDIMTQTLFDEATVTLPGYIVYTYVSYQNVYQLYNDYSEVFVEPYVGIIDSFAQEIVDADQFNSRLVMLLNENDAEISAIFQDSIRDQLRSQDPDSRINQVIQLNDTYAFAPTAPTMLYYCTEDEQVPFQNALLADSVMTALGSDQVVLMNGGPRSHTQCAIPALTAAVDFFSQYANIINDVADRPVDRPELRVFPNPTGAGQALRIAGIDATRTYHATVYDPAGRVVLDTPLSRGEVALPTSLRSGIYVLRLGLPDGGFVTRRFVVRP